MYVCVCVGGCMSENAVVLGGGGVGREDGRRGMEAEGGRLWCGVWPAESVCVLGGGRVETAVCGGGG